MNFSELGEKLNMSREGARKRVLKFKDHEDLLPYLEYDGERISGLNEDGIEVLRNIGSSRRSFSKERALSSLKGELSQKQAEIEAQRQINETQKRYIDHLEQEIKDLKDQNTKLSAELQTFKGMSLWQRLTYRG